MSRPEKASQGARVVGAAVAAALAAFVAGAAAPVGAQESPLAAMTVQPDATAPGTTVQVAGGGCAYGQVTVRLDDTAPVTTPFLFDNGAWSLQLPVPADTTPGTHTIHGTCQISAEDTAYPDATLTVTAPTTTSSTSTTTPPTTVLTSTSTTSTSTSTTTPPPTTTTEMAPPPILLEPIVVSGGFMLPYFDVEITTVAFLAFEDVSISWGSTEDPVPLSKDRPLESSDDRILLKTVTADGRGAVHTTVQPPAGSPPGSYIVEARGLTSGRVVTIPIILTAPTEVLARTGQDSSSLTALALSLMTAGIALCCAAASRRRRRPAHAAS